MISELDKSLQKMWQALATADAFGCESWDTMLEHKSYQGCMRTHDYLKEAYKRIAPEFDSEFFNFSNAALYAALALNTNYSEKFRIQNAEFAITEIGKK